MKITGDSTTLVRKGTVLLKDSAQNLSNGTYSGLKQRDGSLEWTAVIKGEIECGCRNRAGVTAASIPVLVLNSTSPMRPYFLTGASPSIQQPKECNSPSLPTPGGHTLQGSLPLERLLADSSRLQPGPVVQTLPRSSWGGSGRLKQCQNHK